MAARTRPGALRLATGLTAVATTAALALVPATATSSPAPDRPDRPGERAPGRDDGPAPLLGTSAQDRYIVVFEKGTSQAAAGNARARARDRGASIRHTYDTALDGFAATLPPQALNGLRNNPRVAFIEADRPVSTADVQSPATWGLDRTDQRALPLDGSYDYDESGAGVTAYVIDTGIRRTHAEFSGRAVAGYSAINDGRGTDDCNGHGTHVAGTVGGETYGVAQDVRLVAVRVLDCRGSGSNSGVIAGVDWVTANHTAGSPAVANMSLGGGASSALDAAVRSSIADGVTYALAAGNDYGADACGGSPSRVAEGLTIGSSTRSDARSSFSNIGSCLDLFAPGSDITSAWINGDTSTNTISGTSMATPHVAGAAAVYLEANPGASPAAVGEAIVSGATTGVLSGVGSGSPNRLLFSSGSGTPGPSPEPEPEPSACDLPETASGSLSGAGDLDYHPAPEGYFYSAASGTHTACLDGPSGTDFDLYLERWNGSSWVVVAQGITSGPDEQVSHTASSGYYSWRVESYAGSGAYAFAFDRP